MSISSYSNKTKQSKNSLFLLTISIVLGSIGQLLMKSGAKDANIENIYELLLTVFSPLVILGLIAYIIASALWLIILTRMPLSVAYPFGAAAYIIVVFASVISGEPLLITRLVGVVLIITGIILVGAQSLKSK